MFPKNWVEELVSEWLQMDGYFVETGVPLLSGKKGGRAEIDIIAVKNVEGQLNIQHIEVGVLGRNASANLEAIKKKFSESRRDEIIRYVQKRLNITNVEYHARYIASWISQRSIEFIRKEGFKIDRLGNVIQKEILPGIVKWKRYNQSKSKFKQSTPPQNLWLIQLLEFCMCKGVEFT